MKNKILLGLSFLTLTGLMFGTTSCQKNETPSNDDDVVIDDDDDGGEVVTTPFAITSEIENGYSYDEESATYTINVAGEYTFTGDLVGKVVFVDSLVSKCTINLNQCSITSTSECLSWTSEESKVILNALVGTTNTFTTVEAEGTAAAISSTNNLDIEGDGFINVESKQGRAIDCQDLDIAGSETFMLDCVSSAGEDNPEDGINCSELTFETKGMVSVETDGDDAISCKLFKMSDGYLTVNGAGDNGIKAGLTSKNKKGTISVTGGNLTITDCKGDAMNAESSISVTGGELAFANCEGYAFAAENDATIATSISITGGTVVLTNMTNEFNEAGTVNVAENIITHVTDEE